MNEEEDYNQQQQEDDEEEDDGEAIEGADEGTPDEMSPQQQL